MEKKTKNLQLRQQLQNVNYVQTSVSIKQWPTFAVPLVAVLFFVFFTQLGHLHSIPCSSICWPIALVILTHFPWNQSSQLSQHIINLLLCGCLHIHHNLQKINQINLYSFHIVFEKKTKKISFMLYLTVPFSYQSKEN